MLAKKIRDFIESKGLVVPGESVLVAVSGGADSVALLHVMKELHEHMGFGIEAAHLNHGIRKEAADADALFVKELCKKLDIVCHVEKRDATLLAKGAKLSVEEAARELRYKFLEEVSTARGHGKIALGHTMNDQAETVLMRLIRGSGLLGVSGMKPISRVFIRPFLRTKRAEIEEFLSARGIAHREDASNADTTFMRNRVRIELVELLKKEYNAGIVEVLGSHAVLLGQAEDFLAGIASEAYEDCLRSETLENIELELTTLVSYHVCVQSYVFREAYRRLRGSLKDLGFVHIASLENLACSGQSGDSIDIPSGVSAWREGQSLWLGKTATLRSPGAGGPIFSVNLEPGREVRLAEPELKITSRILLGGSPESTAINVEDIRKAGPGTAFFDLGGIEPPFVLRNLKNGDRMVPFGMNVPKKVQDLLVDMKVPRSTRKNVTALCDNKQIIWLLGIRRSNAAPVTNRTRQILSVEVEKL